MRRTKLLLSVSVAAMLALGACGSSGTTASDSGPGGGLYGAGSTTSTSGAASSAPSTASSDDAATVMVARNDTLGEHLVDGQGRTLYLLAADKGLKTACTGPCVSTWPPATTARPTAGSGLDGAKLISVAGAAPDQVAYNGHLLYRYAGDAAKGDANGTSIPQWYAVSPEGEQIEAP